jgi:hypothetical protein
MEVFEENQAGRTAMGFVRSLTDTLGDDVVVYRSMTTGGGGLLSSVASVEVENERALNEWLTRTVAMGNGAGAAFLRGYATVVRREAGGRTLWSLRTTGLPLPLDVTVGVGGGRAFIGATSGAVMSAMDHASGGALSVLENAGFRRSMAPALRGDVGLVGVRWRDMAWHAERSYVIAEAFGVAAANAVRERFGGERDPGRVVPSYGAFMRDIDPAAGWTYWDGDDLVGYAESDGSLLVNLAVSAREAAWQQLLSGVPGLALPAFEQGRRTGMQIRERERMLEPAQPR